MLRRDEVHDRDDRFLGEGIGDRAIRVPAKKVAGKKKSPNRPAPLAPDAKRYNDEIPDPEAEDIVPE